MRASRERQRARGTRPGTPVFSEAQLRRRRARALIAKWVSSGKVQPEGCWVCGDRIASPYIDGAQMMPEKIRWYCAGHRREATNDGFWGQMWADVQARVRVRLASVYAAWDSATPERRQAVHTLACVSLPGRSFVRTAELLAYWHIVGRFLEESA